MMNEKDEHYCQMAFDLLNTHLSKWDKKDFIESGGQIRVANMFYSSVFYAKSIKTGIVGMDSFNDSTVDDHFISPRVMCHVIMEKMNHLLDDYEEFKEYFHCCQHTIKISSRKNNLVKIKNNNGKIRIPRLTVDKYDDLKYYNKNTCRIETEFPLKHMVPKEFTEYEEEHLLT